ncbi:hypothetical protein C5Y93_18300 [Blastopirellula marina]|uniref:MalT-like TPR region domain-containing protein n=1 Tax=Blastopirellula marina TaxID=124 RepID=A0A2S8GJU9_9BACT|nr:hypothetical protein C5Y93_18300 [Blastopirellula marina]
MIRQLSSLIFLAAVVATAIATSFDPRPAYAADEQAKAAEFEIKQDALIERFNAAKSSLDIQAQAIALRELRDLFHDVKVLEKEARIADVDFMLRDLEQALTFPPEKLASAQEVQRLDNLGAASGNPEQRLRHYRQALELAGQVYGPTSFHYVAVELGIAMTCVQAGYANDPEGIAAASHARDTLENLGMLESRRLREAHSYLAFLYYSGQDYANALSAGERAIELYGTTDDKQHNDYLKLATALTHMTNDAGRYQDSIEHARKILNSNVPLRGKKRYYYARTLRFYAEAKGIQKDFEMAEAAYEEYLLIVDRIIGFPPAERLSALKELSAVLKARENHDRLAEIEQEIAEFQLPPDRSPGPSEQETIRIAVKRLEAEALFTEARNAFNVEGQVTALRDVIKTNVELKTTVDDANAAHAAYLLDDMERIAKLPEQRRQEAIESIKELATGTEEFQEEDYASALNHIEVAMELARNALGGESYHYVKAEVDWAESTLSFGGQEDRDQGLAYLRHARDCLEQRGAVTSVLYLKTMTLLTRYHIDREDSGATLETGKIATSLYDMEIINLDNNYSLMTGYMAHYLNKIGKHRAAGLYARAGALGNAPKYGKFSMLYARNLQEFTRAGVGLREYGNCKPVFEELLRVAERNPDCPREKRIEYLEEYLAFLKLRGEEEPLDEIVDKLAQLKKPLQKSRYSW